jgi:hypothetical protein
MKLGKNAIIFIFVSLYLLVSSISVVHSIDFFRLSTSNELSIALAIAFELGAAASLCALAILDKTNKFLVWSLFIVLTLYQIMCNVFHSYSHAEDYAQWMELFGLQGESAIYQKRVLGIVSGSILPLIALGFIKSLVDYLKTHTNPVTEEVIEPTLPEVVEPEAPESELVRTDETDEAWKELIKNDQIDNKRKRPLSTDEKITRGVQ